MRICKKALVEFDYDFPMVYISKGMAKLHHIGYILLQTIAKLQMSFEIENACKETQKSFSSSGKRLVRLTGV